MCHLESTCRKGTLKAQKGLCKGKSVGCSARMKQEIYTGCSAVLAQRRSLMHDLLLPKVLLSQVVMPRDRVLNDMGSYNGVLSTREPM